MIVGGRFPRARTIDGDEQDVVMNWREFYTWTKRPGATSKVKRRIRRRERREGKSLVAQALSAVTSDW